MDYNELQLKAATDVEFRQQLIDDPKAILQAQGAQLPEGVGVKVVESTPEEIVLAIPAMLPDGVSLDEDALADATGGIVSTPACLVGVAIAVGAVISVPATAYSGYIVGKEIKHHFG
ncbi:MAG: NHLP leader peptide family RiPP precursor [Candidatus Nanopelagicales bacterium]